MARSIFDQMLANFVSSDALDKKALAGHRNEKSHRKNFARDHGCTPITGNATLRKNRVGPLIKAVGPGTQRGVNTIVRNGLDQRRMKQGYASLYCNNTE